MADNIHDGHRLRLKQRFLEQNLDGFDPINVLELLLFFSVSRKDTNPLAHNLLNCFHTIDKVFDATYEELLKVEGISPNSAVLMKMVPALSRIYTKSRDQNAKYITSEVDAGKYMLPFFVGAKNEMVYLMCLDNKGKVLGVTKLSEGSACSAHISLRIVVAEALRLNATQIILAHNHPGGVALPSAEDLDVTKTLKRGLEQMEISLADHLLVADGDFVSLQVSGFMRD